MSCNEHAFDLYGDYYDLFYQDKGYLKEAQYIVGLLKTLTPGASKLIELGSGTGNYSRYFSDAGFTITGIEKSGTMVTRSLLKSIKNFKPLLHDIVSFDLGEEYDAAVSLFDVMCYLTRTDDLLSCFNSVAQNLKKGGVFIFDSWYTPAVYSSPPVVRIKRAENDEFHITRLAEPEMDYQCNTVNVHYEFVIRDKKNNQYSTLKELHTLRHFNVPEINAVALSSGFELIGCEELLTGKPVDNNTWKVCYKLRKK
jgi:SAM-dependent methyltransferase